MHRPRVKNLLFALLVIVLAFGIAACGGKKSGGDTTKSTKKEDNALGMDHRVACKVYDHELTSNFINDRIEDTRDFGENQDPPVDYEDFEIEDYDDDASVQEANHMDFHIEKLAIEELAKKNDIEVPDDDVEDRIKDEADESNDGDLDEFYEDNDEQYSLDKDSVKRLYKNILIEDEVTEAIEDDDEGFEDFDDFADFTEEARDEAEDHVDCGKDFDWDPDKDYSFVDPEAETDTTSDTETETTTTTTTTTETVDPALASGAEYNAKVGPRLLKFERVILRFMKVLGKLGDGKISPQSTIGGFKRQQKEMKSAIKFVKSYKPGDPYLAKTHRHLILAESAFNQTLSHMINLGKPGANIDREYKAALAALGKTDKELTAWKTGLSNDPDGRDFTRLIKSLNEVLNKL